MNNEYGWLIENCGFGDELRYLTAEDGDLVWTADPYEALRFSRQIDAERVAEMTGDATCPLEHCWSDTPTARQTSHKRHDEY